MWDVMPLLVVIVGATAIVITAQIINYKAQKIVFMEEHKDD